MISLEIPGQLFPLLRGDKILSFGFQVGDRRLVFPQVNLL